MQSLKRRKSRAPKLYEADGEAGNDQPNPPPFRPERGCALRVCFCGCGRTIPRFPIGTRSINKRGLLVSEWLAWGETVLAADRSIDPDEAPSLEPWLDGGRGLVAELRAAMHGEIDPQHLNEAEVRAWQEIAWRLDSVAVSAGRPDVTTWLATPDASEIVRLVAQGGHYESGGASELPSELTPLDAEAWRRDASMVAANEFDPVEELTLQQATKQALDLDFFDPLPDSELVHLSTVRLGYAMRNLEVQRVPNASHEKPNDRFIALVDDRGKAENYPHPGIDRWLTAVVIEITDDPSALERVLGEMPGASPYIRSEAMDLVIVDYPEMDRCEMTRLLLCGFLIHRVAEVRPIFG